MRNKNRPSFLPELRCACSVIIDMKENFAKFLRFFGYIFGIAGCFAVWGFALYMWFRWDFIYSILLIFAGCAAAIGGGMLIHSFGARLDPGEFYYNKNIEHKPYAEAEDKKGVLCLKCGIRSERDICPTCGRRLK